MELRDLNTLTNLEEISLAMKVAQISEQPNTLISPSGTNSLQGTSSDVPNTQTNTKTNTQPSKNHTMPSQPLNHPPIRVAVYRTIPLEPLPILPILKWKNPYKTVKARVNSYRK